MKVLKRYQDKWFKFCVYSLLVITALLIATADAAIRDDTPPDVQNSLPAVCLDGATVCTTDNPMRGDFNNNGELDAGDLVVMQRAVLGLGGLL